MLLLNIILLVNRKSIISNMYNCIKIRQLIYILIISIDALEYKCYNNLHFQIQTTITVGWYKKGSAPKIKSFPSRQKASYSGFVIPETRELLTSKPTTFNYETTIESIRSFLSAHPAPADKKYAIVMDNAPWHKKAIRLVETEKNPEHADILKQVIFVKLPPYSPYFNPIEQVWIITRRENTHNVFFADIQTLISKVDKAFDAWSVPNSQLVNLCSFSYS